MGEGDVVDADGAALPGRRGARRGRPRRRSSCEEKEGLALINGTDGMLGMLVLAIADLGAAASRRRRHRGDERRGAAGHRPRLRRRPAGAAAASRPGAQRANMTPAARRLGDRRRRTSRTYTRVQDAYSLRCAPQVHGAARDTVAHARRRGRARAGLGDRQPGRCCPTGAIESNGNFHGAPVAYVLDFLAIVAADLASISERRTDRHAGPARNHGLPPFLADDPGVDSGLMIAQYTQAAHRLRDEAAGRAGERGLDPALGDAGGPRLDGLARRAQAAPRGRRPARVLADRAAGRRARARPARARSRPAAGTGAVRAALRAHVAAARARPLPVARDRGRVDARRPSGAGRWPPKHASVGELATDPRDATEDAWNPMTADPAPSAPRAAPSSPRRAGSRRPPLRMLQNNLDPEVAEHPDELVVYGGTGKAARNWAAFDAHRRARCAQLKDDETMLVQSGKPVGVFRTHEWAPRVLIANSQPRAATGPPGRSSAASSSSGLTMYGQMTAGSWIYIGTQGILQGTYETFAAVGEPSASAARSPARSPLTGGLRRHGRRAAARRHDERRRRASSIDVDPTRLAAARRDRYLDEIDRQPRRRARARARRQGRAQGRSRVGLVGNAADVAARAAAPRTSPIDIVTDQTSAHDPLVLPARGHRLRRLARLRRARSPRSSPSAPARRWPSTSRRWSASWTRAPRSSTTATRSATRRRTGGYDRAFDFPGFVPAYIRPLFCEGKGPFRWAALSGDPTDIAAHRPGRARAVPRQRRTCTAGSRMAQERVAFQGLPARICWLGYGERDKAGVRVQRHGRRRRASARRSSSAATTSTAARSPRRTARPRRCSTAPTRSPTGRCSTRMVNTASGASWVSIHHGGGVGIGRSIHAGQVSVADGTPLAAEKLARVLTNDPGMGVIRHVDAGYDRAVEVAERARRAHPDARGRRRGADAATAALDASARRQHRRARHERPALGDGSRSGSCATPRSSSRTARVAWVGRARPTAPATDDARRRRRRARSIPGFVDSHAHLVFAGDRSAEFAARMAGEPYTAGGIAHHGRGHPRGDRRRAARERARRASPRCDALRHDDGREQVRLRPRRRRRGAPAARRPRAHATRRRSSARTPTCAI